MSISNSNDLIDRAATATDQAATQALDAARRGVAAVRSGSRQMLDQAHHASLIAAATGAALMALVGLMTRPRDRI